MGVLEQPNALAAVPDNAFLIGVPVILVAHCGERECRMPGLAVPISVDMVAARSPPLSAPANRKFFGPRATARRERSTA